MSLQPTSDPRGRWARVDALFQRLAPLSPAARTEALDALERAGDGEVAAAVRRLLDADDAATSRFLLPVLDRPDREELETPDPPTPVMPEDATRQIGPYRLLERLGAGGMGVVYRAARDDGQFEDRVAIKRLRGGLDDARARSRFLAERQILASLRHPNIAYLLDGGVDADDHPYLVMELIEGRPIDIDCAARRLGARERIRLVLQVCAGVAQAHRQLVVHRDLKPSNVMVTRDGVVKLLDFGIAKLLDTTSRAGVGSGTGPLVMTPLFASPEQLRGERIDTATDVYQLGMLLYLLLAGDLPYRYPNRTPGAIARVVLREEPRRASAVAHELTAALDAANGSADGSTDGSADSSADDPADEPPPLLALAPSERADLDAILGRCVRKDSAARYPSVDALRGDLEAFLGGFPVAARDGGRVYRWRKLVRRRRATVAAAAASLLLVVAVFVFGIAWMLQARALEAERDRARHQARRASAVAGFLSDIFAQADPEQHLGDEPTARDLLDQGAARLAGLRTPAERAELGVVIGSAYAHLHHWQAARETMELAVAAADEADDPALRATVLQESGQTLRLAGDLDEAAPRVEEALALREQVVAAATDPRALGAELGRTLYLLAEVRREQGDLAASEALYRRARAVAEDVVEAVVDGVPTGGEVPFGLLGDITSHLAVVVQFQNRHDEATALVREAIALYRAVYPENDPHVLEARHNLAMLSSEAGDAEAAESLMLEVLDGFGAVYGRDHANYATPLNNLGIVLFRAGRVDEAVERFEEAFAIRRRIFPDDHPEIAVGLHNLGVVHGRLGHIERAEALLGEAIERRAALYGREHSATRGSIEELELLRARAASASATEGDPAEDTSP